MNKEIERKLLKTKTLDEFRLIVYKNGIATTDSLSKEALEHYNKLGSMHSVETHIDPRKK